MSTIIKNIAIYLSPKLGNSSNILLNLAVYKADHDLGGVPNNESPLGFSERLVSDIMSEGWYVFEFSPNLELDTGYYCMVLNQRCLDVNNVDEDVINENFVEWTFSQDVDTLKDTYAFSSAYGFSALSAYTNAYTTSYVYGYGYGYGFHDPLDYFDVISVSGDSEGYAADEVYPTYSYGSYGFENVDFTSDTTIRRNFKIYDEFNDIEIDATDKEVVINLPASKISNFELENRQDFIDSSRNFTEVSNDYITLAGSGERIYSSDITSLDVGGSFDFGAKWDQCNMFLSNNDINYLDISNPSGNSSKASTWLVSAPYFSGIYGSVNSGSTWKKIANNLTLSSGNARNFSCVKFGENASYIIAFDNSNSSEKGKMFFAEPSSSDISSENVSWTEKTGLPGRVINDIYVLDSNTIYAGTDNGVYYTNDSGDTWLPLNTGCNSNVNQITADLNTSLVYGYGYGYGEGSDYFDVIAYDGYLFGYGVDNFESSYSEMYSYGYGYEYSFSGGTIPVLFIATDDGAFRYNGNSWIRISEVSLGSSYTIHLASTFVYLGTDDGFFRASIDSLAEILDFEGMDESDSFYAQGVSKNKTTMIRTNPSNDNEIYVTQFGGVFVSKNGGGNFTCISHYLEEKNVKSILFNPINSRILYITTQSSRFSSGSFTFLVDCSGSMIGNDPDNDRIDFVENLINSIVSNQTNTSYFQLITFGISGEKYNSIKEFVSSDPITYDVDGVINLTSGFTSNDQYVIGLLESCKTQSSYEMKRTQLFDGIDITSESLNNDGSDWSYDSEEKYYELNKIISQYYSETDKILIIITDGFNSVLGKTINNISGSNSKFSNILGKIYLISIGQNTNLETLEDIFEVGENSKLYNAPFGDSLNSEIFNEISNIEKYRKRSGTWNKVIDLGENRKITGSRVSAHIPTNTSATYRIRVSEDKDNWGSWTSYQTMNNNKILDLFGRFVNIEILLESNFQSYAPEVYYIKIETYDPSESKIFYDSQSNNTGEEISQIVLSSLDDISLNNFTNHEAKTDFGISESESNDFVFFDTIHRGKRSVIKRKKWENLNSSDGYFFTSEGGPWPYDFTIEIYDVTEGVDSETEISPDEYYTIPSLGRVVFYSKREDYNLKIRFSKSVSDYTVGVKLSNFDETSKDFTMRDISWMFYEDSGTTETQRTALPLVSSQLGGENIYGNVTPTNIESSLSEKTTISLQYINKDRSIFTEGIISFISGLRINLQTDSSESDNMKFYNQGIFLESFNFTSPTASNYVKVDQNVDGISQTVSDSLNYQIDLSLDSYNLNPYDSITMRLGDMISGGDGMSTYFYQDNLLFDSTDKSIAEITKTFIVGDRPSLETPPDASLVEGEPSDSFNGFDKPLSPNINFCGGDASKLIIISPTIISKGSPFTFSVLAVDDNGLIDRNFDGTIVLSFANSGFGTFTTSTYEFSTSDYGSVKLTAQISSSASGYSVINCSFLDGGIVYESNPIVVKETSSTRRILWGDFNVSTVFSDGHQDHQFVIDYAKDISLLNFVSISDDISQMNEAEWDYSKYTNLSGSDSDLYVFTGLRSRSDDYLGERVIVFESLSNLPNSIPSISGSSGEYQIRSLYDNIWNYPYISIPIHTPYENISGDSVFSGRGFDFEKYREILSYTGIEESFVKDNEVAVEIYSDHGLSEINSTLTNENFLTSESTHFINHALQIGKKFAFTASAGNYSSRPGYYGGEIPEKSTIPSSERTYGRGLTAIDSEQTGKNAVFSGMRDRSTYATTGPRIYIDFEGYYGSRKIKMGSGGNFVLQSSFNDNGLPSETVSFKFRIIGDNSNISRIQIRKIKIDGSDGGSLVLDTFNTSDTNLSSTDFGRDTGYLTFTDSDIQYESVDGSEYCYYLKVYQIDGHIGWSSPIWFNFGRDIDKIKTSSEASKEQIYGIKLIKGTSLDNYGSIGGAPIISMLGEYLPYDHLPLLTSDLNTYETPRSTTRGIPYSIDVDGAETDMYLYVSDNSSTVKGFRMWSDEDINIVYGSHYVKFLKDKTSFNPTNIRDVTSSPINGYAQYGESSFKGIPPEIFNEDKNQSRILQGFETGENQYKFINDDNDITSDREKRYRDYLFGSLWQYSGNKTDDFRDGNFRSGYSLEDERIYIPSAPDEFIIGEPYIERDGSRWHLFYRGFVSSYPEKNINSVEYPPSGISDDYIGRTEEFAGLFGETFSTSSPLRYGESFRIVYANNDGQSGQRIFVKKEVVPNLFNNNQNRIYYSSSPSFVRVSSSDFRVYYVGWFEGKANLSTPKPMMGLFCYRFTDFDNLSSSGENTLCFVFHNGEDDSISEFPSDYTSRKTTYEPHHFFAKEIRQSIISKGWPEIHPLYTLPWSWFTVVKKDDSYYAFFNYMNKLNWSSNPTGDDSPATGIIFSSDGFLFREFDSINEQYSLSPIPNSLFFHPEQVSTGNWYSVYRDYDAGSVSFNLIYSRFNWVSEFES